MHERGAGGGLWQAVLSGALDVLLYSHCCCCCLAAMQQCAQVVGVDLSNREYHKYSVLQECLRGRADAWRFSWSAVGV